MTLKINYEQIINESLKQAIKEILINVSKNGLPGEHHFYISFITKFQGVEIAEWMIKDYPNEMTIVIQNWFDDLYVDDNYFSIILNFKNKPEKMIIPFESIISFSDPSVNFSLHFEESKSQNLDHLANTPESSNHSKSSNNELTNEKQDNIIQFEKFKKSD